MTPQCVWPATLIAFVLGGCPTDTTSASDSTAPDWLDGSWRATAITLGNSVTGCVTIAGGRVIAWGHGCTGEVMPILDAPTATFADATTAVAVTVRNTEGAIMQVKMQLSRVTDDLLTGSITTLTLGATPFIGTVTLQRR